MHAPLSLLLLSALSLIAVTNGQHNVTVNNTSPLITYGGNARDSLMCKYTPEGTLVSGQGACWNVLPTTCTDGISMGQGGSGTASFSFKGSAIYINSVLSFLSPIFTVTIDGQSTDVDGVRDSKALSCFPLYAQTGLDPNVEHQIKLSVKGASPNRNTSIPNSETLFAFSFVSFVYTAGDGSNNTSSSSTASDGSSPPTAAGSTKTNTGPTSGTTQQTTGGFNLGGVNATSASTSSATSDAAPTASSTSAAEMRHTPTLLSAAIALFAVYSTAVVIW